MSVDVRTGEIVMYQLLPRLTSDEYGALREDIETNGIRVPVDVDEDGNVLDGHHRVMIATEFDLEYPVRVLAGLTDQQKRDHARSVNALRRSLTPAQRREQILAMRHEGQSIRAIGTTLGIPKSTVADVLDDVSESGHVEDFPDTITDTLGRQQPAKKATHECACGESFTRPVWHCDRCGNHWDVGQVCDTCAEHTATVDTGTGEVVAPPEPTTKKRARTPRGPFEQTAEEAREVSNRVYSKTIAESVWMLATYNMHPNAAVGHAANWDATQDIYPEQCTPARMRQAAAYLSELADAWEAQR